MRRVLFFSFVATTVLIIALGGALTNSEANQQGQPFQQVNIRVNCANGQVSGEPSIVPWNVRASRAAGQQIRWRLLPASDISSATIRPKSTSTWPFASQAPITVTSGGNNWIDSGAITGANGDYYYDVVVNCGNGEHVIDPRMDIDP